VRVLHTMIRVGDLEKSIAFYTETLGMTLMRRHDYPEGKFTLAFVGYGDEASTAVIELTHNWETSSYDLGNGFGHIAIGADDIVGACDRVREYGGVVTREPGPMKHGTTVIAFAKDPDGYSIEFIEKKIVHPGCSDGASGVACSDDRRQIPSTSPRRDLQSRS